jgi:hypothetical protein
VAVTGRVGNMSVFQFAENARTAETAIWSRTPTSYGLIAAHSLTTGASGALRRSA